MSIVTSTSEQICHSPTNQSKAKMLYSFSKSSRFPKSKENEYELLNLDVIIFMTLPKEIIWEPQTWVMGPSMISLRSINLVIFSSPKTPAPGRYEAETTF